MKQNHTCPTGSARGPGARLRISLGVVLAGGVATADMAHAEPITLNLTARWTDSANTVHMARNVKAEFRDSDLIFDDVLGTAQTSNTGQASLVTENTDGLGGGTLDPYMRIFASSQAGFVSSGGTPGTSYYVDTPVAMNVPGPAYIRDFTIGNTTAADRAFSVHQALQFGFDYATSRLAATTSPQPLAVKFPDAGGTRANNSNMWVQSSDWADWDVILHEYGHYLAFNNNLHVMPTNYNYDHKPGVDNIGKTDTVKHTTLTKEDGVKTAWVEGVASYLGLSIQADGHLRTVIPGLPALLGDKYYDDPEPVSGGGTLAWHVGIEGRNDETVPGTYTQGIGEDDELSVMRILWDVFDEGDEKYASSSNDDWALDTKDVFDLMKGSTSLADFWSKTVTDYTDRNEQKISLGALFEEYGVSAVPTAQTPLANRKFKFKFNEQNHTLSDYFEVIIFDELFRPYERSGVLHNTTEWTNLRPLDDDGLYHWVVSNDPVAMIDKTDYGQFYWSGARSFWVPEPDAGLLSGLGLLALAGAGRRRPSKKTQLARPWAKEPTPGIAARVTQAPAR